MAAGNDKAIAVKAEVLYLLNLLVLPGIAFIGLLLVYRQHHSLASPLARCHLLQTLSASIWAGVLLVPVTLLTLVLGGYDTIGAWAFAILYFTVCHASLVLLGVVGLAKAMAGRPWRYPLIGRPCEGMA